MSNKPDWQISNEKCMKAAIDEACQQNTTEEYVCTSIANFDCPVQLESGAGIPIIRMLIHRKSRYVEHYEIEVVPMDEFFKQQKGE